MAKLVTNDIASFSTGAVATVNDNFAAVETAMENTLSRDGTTPNSMSADFDLNGNTILNIDGLDMNDTRITGLVAAVADDEPLRKAEFDDLVDDLDNIFVIAAQVHQDALQATLDLDEFNDIYLGSKTSDPALDNDGDALQTGAIYFNSATDVLKFYDGVSWVAITASSPADADYLVRTANASLSAERVVTDTTSITWDWGTAGQAKAQRAALTGDVTASANSNSTTIANDAVTYAKMQNVSAASKLLGRGDSGSGDPQEITLGSNISMSGTTLNVTGGSGDVTAAATLTDNRLMRGDGGVKGIQDSVITVADTTGALSRTGGIAIQGTNTNDDAAAGYIGEVITSTIASASAVSLTTATPTNVTSISLTAGDWDVWGTVYTNHSLSQATIVDAAISTTSASVPAFNLGLAGRHAINQTSAILGTMITPTGTVRLSLSGTTTVYLVASSTFASGTNAAHGTIVGRRAR